MTATAGLFVGLPLTGCVQKAPNELVERIDAIDRQLTETRASEYAPEEYGRFIKHWLAFRARLQAEEDVIRWPWETNPLVAELQKLQEEGATAVDQAARKREDERGDAETRLAALEQRVQGFTARVNEIGSRIVLGQKLVETELLLKQARSFFDQGAYARSVEVGHQATKLVDDQTAMLNDALGRYADADNVDRWQHMVKRTVEWSKTQRTSAIVVSKADRRLTVYKNGRVLASYPVKLGYNGILEKRYQGDGATPEGLYRVIKRRDRGETAFYKAFLLDYPNTDDRRRFREARSSGAIPSEAYIGGQIEIHGGASLPMSQTLGCVMVSDRHMDVLFKHVGVGTPVTIVGAVNRSNSIAMALAELDQSEEG